MHCGGACVAILKRHWKPGRLLVGIRWRSTAANQPHSRLRVRGGWRSDIKAEQAAVRTGLPGLSTPERRTRTFERNWASIGHHLDQDRLNPNGVVNFKALNSGALRTGDYRI